MTVDRAQIIYKQTTLSKHTKLNFEQFLFALKKLAVHIYPIEDMMGAYADLDSTIEEMANYEN